MGTMAQLVEMAIKGIPTSIGDPYQGNVNPSDGIPFPYQQNGNHMHQNQHQLQQPGFQMYPRQFGKRKFKKFSKGPI